VPTGAAVAITLLRDGDAGAALAAALAEAAAPRAIDHPAVVRVLDVGHDPATGQCYLVMERLDGEALAARLARVGHLDEASARRLGAMIAEGMAAVHARGIVHRDLKPANVIVHGEAPTIVDFGIAKHLGERTVATTARRIGTPPYMAPEQFTGGVITPAVDVFALGVMLFELVTGELPFVGYDDGRCPQLFDAPRRLGGRGSPDLDALIARCLAREPGQRPRAMTEVARALRGEAGTVGDIADERVTEDAGPVLPTARGVVAMTAGPVRRGARWPWIAAAVIAGAALIGVVVAVAFDGGAAKASAKGPATVTEGRGDGDGSGDSGDGRGDGSGRGRERDRDRDPRRAAAAGRQRATRRPWRRP
jgi:serine/threonine-protein kinase